MDALITQRGEDILGKLFVLCCIVAAFASTAASANLITNGSFESGIDPGILTTLNATSTAIVGWTVTEGSIDYIGTYWTASDGARSLDLAGRGAGAITDLFNTAIGTPYILQFDLAGNSGGGDPVKIMDVTIRQAGSDASTWVTQSFTFDTAGKSRTNMGWVTDSLLFNGFGANTEIVFASGMGTSPYGPALDNVRVSIVPEPASAMVVIMGLASVVGFRRLRKS